jgi:archaemetzincin
VVRYPRTYGGWILPTLLVVGAVIAVNDVLVVRRIASRAGSKDLPSVRAAMRCVTSLHEAKTPTRPGDWLESHPEKAQTFEEYVASRPNGPTATRTTIYVQPLGEFDADQTGLLDDTEAMLGLFFAVSVKRLDAIGMEAIPDKARRTHPSWGVKQILTSYVLDLLKKQCPRDAVAVIALTPSDLWPGEGWNFVFGEASLTDRVGVWSLARVGDPKEDYPLALRRTLKTAVHETGHMLGIHHCNAYQCGMNGTNNLEESDRTPLWFCPECEAKVWWGCAVADRPRRYEELAKFARERKLKEAAEFWDSSRAALAETR